MYCFVPIFYVDLCESRCPRLFKSSWYPDNFGSNPILAKDFVTAQSTLGAKIDSNGMMIRASCELLEVRIT